MKNSILYLLGILFALVLACQSGKEATNDSPQPAPSGIIAQLKGKVQVWQVEAAYQQYGLKMIKPIDKAANRWLFAYNSEQIAPEQLLKVMRNSQFVAAAEWAEEE